MSLQTAVTDALKTLPQGFAIGYVEMNSGKLLGLQSMRNHPLDLFKQLAAQVNNLLQGQHVVHAEDIVDAARGRGRPQGTHYFNEMILRTDNTLHIFLRGIKRPDHALVFVCAPDANIGMTFFHAHEAQKKIEAEI